MKPRLQFSGPSLAVICILSGGHVRADVAAARLDPERFHLVDVTDRTELSFEESDAYYAILNHVRSVEATRIRQQAAEVLQKRWRETDRFHKVPVGDFPLFYDLTESPEFYRGRPITLSGHLIRLVKYPAGPNDYGIETLYEGWLVTPDSQRHPTIVAFTRLPAGMEIGEQLIDGVSVTGYFLKLHTYASRDRKTRFAPMVLAHTLTWNPPHGEASGWPVSNEILTGIVAVLGTFGLVGILVLARRSRLQRRDRFEATLPETPPEFLNDVT